MVAEAHRIGETTHATRSARVSDSRSARVSDPAEGLTGGLPGQARSASSESLAGTAAKTFEHLRARGLRKGSINVLRRERAHTRNVPLLCAG